MRKVEFWIQLLIFGVISSSCISCTKTKDVDYTNKRDYLYVNSTVYPVTLSGYRDSQKFDWAITPNDTLKFSFDLMFGGGIPLLPFSCDSVQVIFGNSKQIMFRRNDGQDKISLLTTMRMQNLALILSHIRI